MGALCPVNICQPSDNLSTVVHLLIWLFSKGNFLSACDTSGVQSAERQSFLPSPNDAFWSRLAKGVRTDGFPCLACRLSTPAPSGRPRSSPAAESPDRRCYLQVVRLNEASPKVVQVTPLL